MARVLRAVSRRVPSSATNAVSPSGWMRTRTVERRGGMCAHKDGVEDAGDDSNAEQARACKPDGPACDDRRRDDIPPREIAPDAADSRGEVEQIARSSARGKRRRGVREDEQRDETPRKRQAGECERMRVDAGEDRKSTRLNSSHDQISYAVFCL